MRNRKYKAVNDKEFKQIKGLLENFSINETRKVLKQLGNVRAYTTISRVNEAQDFDHYDELVKKETEKRMEQMKREDEKKGRFDDELIEDLKGAYNKIGILLKNLQ